MFRNRIFQSVVAVSLLALAFGCESDVPPEDLTNPAVPPASSDPGFDSVGLGNGVSTSIPGGPGVGDWKETTSNIGGADSDGWLTADPSGKRLNMPIIYFAYDSDQLVPSETANLDRIAAYMADKPQLGLVIEGHCDQRGTEEYNRALGERRANAIRAYLVGRGVADNRLKTKSFGEDQPAVSGEGESVWRQNRRGVPVPMLIPSAR